MKQTGSTRNYPNLIQSSEEIAYGWSQWHGRGVIIQRRHDEERGNGIKWKQANDVMSECIILYETNRAGLLLTNSECKRIPLISITMEVRYASPARRVKKESSLFIFILLPALATITCHRIRYYYKRGVWECSRPSWGRC